MQYITNFTIWGTFNIYNFWYSVLLPNHLQYLSWCEITVTNFTYAINYMKQQVTSDIFLLLLKLICHQARGPILSGYIYSKEQSIGTFMKYCYRRSIMSFSTVMAQVKTHERSKYFSQTRSKLYVTRLHSSEIQNALVSRRSKLLSWKLQKSCSQI